MGWRSGEGLPVAAGIAEADPSHQRESQVRANAIVWFRAAAHFAGALEIAEEGPGYARIGGSAGSCVSINQSASWDFISAFCFVYARSPYRL